MQSLLGIICCNASYIFSGLFKIADTLLIFNRLGYFKTISASALSSPPATVTVTRSLSGKIAAKSLP